MNPTVEQETIAAHSIEPGKALKVVAFAGTGKTSTLVYRSQKDNTSALYLAFNRSVSDEANSKFPIHVECRTPHALAYRAVGQQYRANLSSGLSVFAIRVMCQQLYDAKGIKFAASVMRTLESWMNSADEQIGVAHIIAPEAVRTNEKFQKKVLGAAKEVWKRMLNRDKWIYMTHSGYLKLYQLGKPKLAQSIVLLDESQDTNPVTWDIVSRQLQHGSRVILVGDPYQQIYSWRGAKNAMQQIEAKTCYLTQSFRFGENIADVANEVLFAFFDVPQILRGTGTDDAIVDSFPSGERFTVLTRSNVVLFEEALNYAAQGATIGVATDKFQDFLTDLADIYYLSIGDKNSISGNRFKKFENFEEFCEYVSAMEDSELEGKTDIVESYGNNLLATLEKVKKAIAKRGEKAQVTLTTTHRAKGLEWDNVRLTDDFADLFSQDGARLPLRAPDVKAKCVVEDEVNLYYVALTRARKRLIINPELKKLRHWVRMSDPPLAPISYSNQFAGVAWGRRDEDDDDTEGYDFDE